MKKRPLPAELLLEEAKAFLVWLTREGKIRYVTPFFAMRLGYRTTELVGRSWIGLVHSSGRKEALQRFRLFLSQEDRDVHNEQSQVLTQEGFSVVVRWELRKIRENAQEVTGVFISGEDLTELEQLRRQVVQERIRGRQERLQAVLEATEKERQQIALELHNGVNQILTVCKLLVETERKQQESPLLQRVEKQLQEAINEIRAIAHQLNPGDMGTSGILAAVKALIASINISGKLKVVLKVEGGRYLRALPTAETLPLYRILQEALQNILKHAEASRVTIRLVGTKESVDLEVEDNGKGFVPGGGNGLGLKAVYLRTEAIGGKVYLTTGVGDGTLLSIHVPLRQ